MIVLQSLVLGIVQGLTEFLPVSSSAHLVLLPWLFNFPYFGLTFDVALHVGTLFAVIFYFWEDWKKLIKAFFSSIWERKLGGDPYRILIWLILVGCIPAAIVGFLLEDYVEIYLHHPLLLAGTLISFGALLWLAELRSKKTRNIEKITLQDALFIGLAQALALIPGVSRSGVTITAGLFRGLKREVAARFSFLLATPIIAGAGMLSLRKVFSEGISNGQMLVLIVGILAATISGFLAIKYLLRYLAGHKVNIFAYYRLAVGLLIIFMAWGRM